MARVYINGLGAALPGHVVPNEVLSKLNGIEPSWIVERTGIQSRFLSQGLEKTSTLAAAAAREALESAALPPAELDLIVLATSFPDSPLPLSTAGAVKERLGATRAVALDIHTPAVGFLLALQMAHRYIKSSGVTHALVVGAECFSAAHDLRDRRTCYLFGDGAGAFVLSRKAGFATLEEPIAHARGQGQGPGDWSAAMSPGAFALPLYHQPKERLQTGFEETLDTLLKGARVRPGKLAYVVPQQMHAGAVTAAAARAGLAPGALFDELLTSGNLLSATLPVSLYHLARAGQLAKGHKVALLGTDGRTLWGGAMMTFSAAPGLSLGQAAAGDDPHAAARALETASMLTAGESRLPRALRPPAIRSVVPATECVASVREFSEFRTLLAEEARKADMTGSAVSTILFTIGHPGRLARATLEQMSRETRLIFSRQVRRRDMIVAVAPERYAVILPNQDAADAKRIAQRLKDLLERLDPVEEIEIRALYDTITYRPGERVDAYVGQVLERAGR